MTESDEMLIYAAKRARWLADKLHVPGQLSDPEDMVHDAIPRLMSVLPKWDGAKSSLDFFVDMVCRRQWSVSRRIGPLGLTTRAWRSAQGDADGSYSRLAMSQAKEAIDAQWVYMDDDGEPVEVVPSTTENPTSIIAERECQSTIDDAYARLYSILTDQEAMAIYVLLEDIDRHQAAECLGMNAKSLDNALQRAAKKASRDNILADILGYKQGKRLHLHTIHDHTRPATSRRRRIKQYVR